ncbi:hypothetical protein KI387_028731, partial [Taxus chinensis]
DLEDVQNLLHISSAGQEETLQKEGKSTSQRLEALENEMMQLKEEVQHLANQK